MTKNAFRQLFLSALGSALELAKIPARESTLRSIRIELHAPNAPRGTISFDQALDQIYLGDDRFYKIIDVAAWKTPTDIMAFVRVSGHDPCPLGQTLGSCGLAPVQAHDCRDDPKSGIRSGKVSWAVASVSY